MRKYVVTGGPSVGKTTIINELSKLGYAHVPEVPRIIIKEQKSIDGPILPWKDLNLFQKEVMKFQLQYEEAYEEIFEGEKEIFLDRGVHDSLGYYMAQNMQPDIWVREIANVRRYDKVFFLEQLDLYQNDLERIETPTAAKIVHECVRKVYSEIYKNDFVEVPIANIDDRLKIILSNL